jgi:hypothetical protein
VSIKVRLLFAFILSGVTLGVTIFWYYHTETYVGVQNQEILAEVTSITNEVNKKPKSRLLWRPLDIGEKIANGEAIRTQTNADVKLKFQDGTELQIEPDTFLVISKKEDRIGLNLLEGSLLATQSQQGGKGIVLESSEGDVELSSSSNTIISKSADEKLKINSSDSNSIGLKTPPPGSKIYFTKGEKIPITVQFPPDFDYSSLKVLLGTNRKKLVESSDFDLIEPDKILVNLKEGSNYIQFIGQSKTEDKIQIESLVGRYLGLELKVPEVIFPKSQGEFRRENGELSIIARVTGIFAESYYRLEGSNGLFLEGELDEKGQAKIKIEPGGPYQVSVTTKFKNGKELISEKVSFFVLEDEKKEKPPFDLSISNLEKELMAPLVPFDLRIEWKATTRKDEISTVQMIYEIEGLSEKSSKEALNKKSLSINLKKFGDYRLKILAFNKQGEEIYASNNMSFSLKETPLIGPVLHSYQDLVSTDGKGNITLKWKELDEASGYEIIIFKETEKISTFGSKKNEIALTSLLPGSLTVTITPIDKWKRKGISSEEIRLRVPDVSSIRAPSGKRVKIK